MSKIAFLWISPGAEEEATTQLRNAALLRGTLQQQRSLPERRPTPTTWRPPRFWLGMLRFRLLSVRRPPAGFLSVVGCALAPAGETRRSSSSSPTVRIKRRAERSLARGPSDPQGPGLGYNEEVRSAPLVAASLAPNPGTKRQKKEKKKKTKQPTLRWSRRPFHTTFTGASEGMRP